MGKERGHLCTSGTYLVFCKKKKLLGLTCILLRSSSLNIDQYKANGACSHRDHDRIRQSSSLEDYSASLEQDQSAALV